MGLDVAYLSLPAGAAAPGAWFDLAVALRIRSGAYPDPTSLTGVRRYREWGSARDAGLFLGCAAALMLLFIQPRLAQLWTDPARAPTLTVTVIPSIVAAVIGFFVPTWYRANAARLPGAHPGKAGTPGLPSPPRSAHAPAGGH